MFRFETFDSKCLLEILTWNISIGMFILARWRSGIRGWTEMSGKWLRWIRFAQCIFLHVKRPFSRRFSAQFKRRFRRQFFSAPFIPKQKQLYSGPVKMMAFLFIFYVHFLKIKRFFWRAQTVRVARLINKPLRRTARVVTAVNSSRWTVCLERSCSRV